MSCVEESGLSPDITPHALRHTSATWMVRGGVSMYIVSKYLGHSSIRVTESVYAHHSPEHLKEALEAF